MLLKTKSILKETNFKTDLLWLFAIALITTILIISWSFEHGRLQYQMDYEDIITHIDGLKRWRDISEGGLGTYFGSYIKTPPHAPLHSMMATLGFQKKFQHLEKQLSLMKNTHQKIHIIAAGERFFARCAT